MELMHAMSSTCSRVLLFAAALLESEFVSLCIYLV